MIYIKYFLTVLIIFFLVILYTFGLDQLSPGHWLRPFAMPHCTLVKITFQKNSYHSIISDVIFLKFEPHLLWMTLNGL